MMRQISLLGVMLAASLSLIGCGPGGVAVTGKVTNGSKAYSAATDGDMNITLSGGDASKSFTGKVGEDGSFTIKDANGGNVPFGKYKVNVTKYPTKAEMKPGAPPQPHNLVLGEEWDVSAANHNFTLDTAKLKKQ